MDLKIYYNDLNKLESMYRKSRSIKEKAFISFDYEHLLKLIKDNFDKKIENNLHKYFCYDDRMFKYTSYDIENEFKKNIKFIEKISTNCKNNINLYKRINYYPYNLMVYRNVNNAKYTELLNEFISCLGLDVKKVVNNLINKKRIILLNGTSELITGFCSQNLVLDSTYIGILKSNTSVLYTSLAHELGHAWNFDYMKNYGSLQYKSELIEIPSILFEIMFIDFLEKNNESYEASIINSINYVEYLKYNFDYNIIANAYEGNKLNYYMDDFSLIVPKEKVENDNYFMNLGLNKYYAYENGNYYLDINVLPYFLGQLLTYEILDKMDMKNALEFVKELLIKSLNEDSFKLINDSKILDNTKGFEKRLIKQNEINKKKYNFIK